MPTYPLTFPTNVAPSQIDVKKVWATCRFDNPVDLSSEVQLRNGRRYELDITLQQMNKVLAEVWTQFFEDLQGGFGYFALDMDPLCPGLTPAPGVRNFRLATNEHGWSAKFATEFDFKFTAVERVS